MCFAVSNEDMLVGRTDFRVDSTLSVLFSYLRILYDLFCVIVLFYVLIQHLNEDMLVGRTEHHVDSTLSVLFLY
jgi:hypothetical protein